MNRTKKILIVFICLLLIFPSVHADILGDIGNFVAGGLAGIGSAIVNTVIGIGSAIYNTAATVMNGVSSFFGGGNILPVFGAGVTGVASAPSAPTSAPQGATSIYWGEQPSWQTHTGYGGETTTYRYSQDSYSHEIRQTFAQLELTNLYYETVVKNNKVFADVWVNIYSEITNVGSDIGETKFRIEVDCRRFTDIVQSVRIKYEKEFNTDWIESGKLAGGRIRYFANMWRVPKEKYIYGGDCKVHAELKENVRKTTIWENVFCNIITWATGDTTTDCSTTQETKEEILTKGLIEQELIFTIEPSLPELRGKVGIDFPDFN